MIVLSVDGFWKKGKVSGNFSFAESKDPPSN
jgi:hypothetical protein